MNTLYASVVDARFDVAVPAIYISQFEPFIATGIGHCACSHVPGVAAISDMGEISALFAPRPQAYLNALSDPMFTLKGATLAEQQARVVYDLFGAGSALELRTFAGGHALGQPMREALYGILEHRLLEQGSGEPVPEPSFEPLPENSPELNCFESGKIPSSSKTVRDLAREWAREAVLKLPGPQQLLADATRAKLEALVAPQAASMPVVRSLGTVRVGEIEAEKFEIEPEPGVVLPAHAIISDPSAPIVVLADGLPAVLAGAELSWAARSHGLNALYVAPRGQGETLWPGKDHVVLTNGILLGHPIAGQRAFDLMQAARVASGLVAPNTRVGLVAVSNAALPGLLAQAIWQPFAASAIGPIPSTFLDKFEATLDTSAHIAGILEVADIPQVVSLAASAPLLVQFQTDTHRQLLPEWASWLDQQAELASEIDARESLAWMSARFGVTASKQ